jgi:predicted DNA-binding ribbon-helix-helix protein
MIRKTMRVGEIRTSIKLENEFWLYLKEIADGRGARLSTLVNEVADATPGTRTWPPRCAPSR